MAWNDRHTVAVQAAPHRILITHNNFKVLPVKKKRIGLDLPDLQQLVK
jgi:hypothetical protein